MIRGSLSLYSNSELPADKRRGPLLLWVQSVHNNGWHGASRLITSARTHLCDDEPACHPVRSSKRSLGIRQSYGIIFFSFALLLRSALLPSPSLLS